MSQSYVEKVLLGQPGGPILFTLHGTGGDEHQFPALGRDLLPEATIVSPRGDVSEHGAARYFRRAAEGMTRSANCINSSAPFSPRSRCAMDDQ